MAHLRVLLTLCLVCLFPLSHAVIDLKEANFEKVLQALPEDQVALVEFFASWCPACQRFKPTYEKVGAYFENAPQTSPKVLVARIDCAEEIVLCGKFKVTGFPTIKLGSPNAFIESQLDNLTTYDSSTRTPQSIVDWVASQLHASFKYKDISKQAASLPSNAPASTASLLSRYAFNTQDVEVATVELFSQATLDLHGTQARSALEVLIRLFAEAHPSAACVQGAKSFLDKYSTMWPPANEDPSEALLNFKICGPSPAVKWVACADNGTNSRGFTCGLWMLLHSVSARYPAEKPGTLIISALSALVTHFFKCTMCAEHFKALMASENASAVQSKREAVLWLWRAHNTVNARLAGDNNQEATTLSPSAAAPPKVQWPTVDQCPSCRLPSLDQDEESIRWAEDEVYSFLLRFYGLQSSPDAQLSVPAGETGVRTASGRPEVMFEHRKGLEGGGHATSAGQFTRTTLLFLLLLLGLWLAAAKVFNKQRHLYRRAWAYDK